MAVVAATAGFAQAAADIAAIWHLPSWTPGPDEVHDLAGAARRAGKALLLVRDARGLHLADTALEAPGPVQVDLLAEAGDRSPDSLLGRALGLRRRPAAGLTVLDATAGFGRDATTLKRLGCQVYAVERSPVVGALLSDALSRVPTRTAVPAFVLADARDVLAACPAHQRPQVVILDPMYTGRRRARPRKDRQVLQRLLGPEDHSAGLLPVARATARERVVVKRAPHAAPLDDAPPSFTVRGSRVRFDVYLTT